MQLNPEISEVLREFSINKDEGLLILLGIYFGLDVEKLAKEDAIKAINLTKIVEKRHANNTVYWNMPLFIGQETDWDWVKDEWNVFWNRNMTRKAGNPDCVKRMQEFFKKYPTYRREDVMRATRNYHASQKDAQFLKNSAAFIFDGAGAQKKSILLSWCEKLGGNTSTQMKGNLVT